MAWIGLWELPSHDESIQPDSFIEKKTSSRSLLKSFATFFENQNQSLSSLNALDDTTPLKLQLLFPI